MKIMEESTEGKEVKLQRLLIKIYEEKTVYKIIKIVFINFFFEISTDIGVLECRRCYNLN
jgi:hypothetical protein